MRHALQLVASLIACLTLGFAVLTTGANAQGRGEPPSKEIKLTETQVMNFIAAQADLARLASKVQNASDGAPGLSAELDAVAKKHGFSDFGELDEVAANISIVMAGLNPDTGEFTDPVDVMKQELENVKRDKSIPGEEKELIVAELMEAIETSPAVVHADNIELVKAHRKAIDKALQ
ncbi:MAG: hypothetical protein ACR2OF_05955 [Hyphomicrobium sp.]